MKQRNESPTLHSLIAFDATVKHGSMTLAAEELGISQPLVSQRIRALEEVLGGVLINRENKPTTPTMAGTKYHNEIERSLATILRATDSAKHDFNDFRTKISISAYFGFAFHWLMPRLQRLQQAFPDYLFEIQPTNSLSDLIASQADIVFHYSSLAGKYEYEHMMIEEEVFPVCSPDLAKKLGLKPGQALNNLSDFPLLHKDVDDPRWPNWKSWSKGVGIKPSNNPIGFRYNNFPLIVEAAVAGQGLCLGWKGLITSFTEEAKLVPLGPNLTSPGRGYTICSNYHSTFAIGNVIKWLVNEV